MCFDPVGHIWAVWTDLRPTGIGLTGPWKLGCVRQHQASVPGSAGRGCCLATGLRSSTSRTPSARGLSGECTAWGGIRSVDWQTTCAHFGVHGGACIPWKLDWIRDLALRHPDASQSHGQEPGWALLRHGSGCLQPTLEGLGSTPGSRLLTPASCQHRPWEAAGRAPCRPRGRTGLGEVGPCGYLGSRPGGRSSHSNTVT